MARKVCPVCTNVPHCPPGIVEEYAIGVWPLPCPICAGKGWIGPFDTNARAVKIVAVRDAIKARLADEAYAPSFALCAIAWQKVIILAQADDAAYGHRLGAEKSVRRHLAQARQRPMSRKRMELSFHTFVRYLVLRATDLSVRRQLGYNAPLVEFDA